MTPLFFILLRQIVSAAMARLDRRLADAARAGDTLAESDDAGKGVDHAEAVAGRTRDQQTAIVGAEIERSIARAAAIAAPAAVEPSGRPPTPSGPLWRRPIYNGVEARDIPGLAAHTFKPSCRPRQPPSALGHSQFPSITKSLSASVA